MAHQSGAQVAIVLTKADLATHREQDVAAVSVVAHNTCTVIIESAVTGDGLDQLRALLGPSVTGVMLGKSGVGKSTLINELLGAPLLATAAVRAKDRAGRHTTVARRMVFLDNGAALIDAPGLRTIGLYDAHRGLAATFPEIASKAASCHYRNCTHTTEPHCAVTAAVADGGTTIAPRRLDSYRSIAAEVFD
jgi:ribosome biogenesis GTPase